MPPSISRPASGIYRSRLRQPFELKLLREVFLRHNANETFVLQLLHRHFDMDPNEKLVEYGPVQNPWPVAADQEVVDGGDVLPKSWRMYNNELHPFEFQFMPAAEPREVPVFTKAFVDDLRAVLKTTGLDKIVGIALADKAAGSKPEDLVEITVGRNSMMVPAGKTPVQGVDGTVAAAWSFNGNANDNAKTARWCRHSEPVKDEAVVARWCRHSEPVKSEVDDGASVARWCRHSEPVKDEAKDDADVARWCRHSEPVKDGAKDANVARWCRHSEPVKDEAKDDANVARWCRHSEPVKDEAKDDANVARWCRHSEPVKDEAKDTDVARWCRHSEPVKDEAKDTNVARWCRHS